MFRLDFDPKIDTEMETALAQEGQMYWVHSQPGFRKMLLEDEQ